MRIFAEYENYDGLGLAELIRKKEVSPEELLETAIDRIEKDNPRLNAVITPMYDQARRTIRDQSLTGPFAGVPFLLKDLLAAYAGVPLTNGCKALKDYVPDFDSELVRRYKRSGVVVLGKTNTPEFGLVGYTEPELHGPTRNPWNPEHTPGGSSGGSAAAVSAGMVPLAGGGDGGGSIRIPSSCCGLFGLKPTRGRTPTGPVFGEIWQGAAVEHVLTRSVRDSAAMLDAINGPEAGGPYHIQQPERPYLDEASREPGKLTIAFTTDSPLGTEVHPEYKEATRKTARMLEKLGHRVEEAEPDIDGLALAKSYLSMYYGEVRADIEALQPVIGRKATVADVETLTWTLGVLGTVTSAATFTLAKRLWNIASREMGRFLTRFDLFLTPTIAMPPIRVGELKPKPIEESVLKLLCSLRLGRLIKALGIFDKLAIENLAKTPFTQLANFTGQPAMSVPLHSSSDGLPCGLQFMARTGDEATLFRLAGQLEREHPWFANTPKGKK